MDRAQKVGVGSAVLAIAVAIVVLVGWGIGSETLTSLVPGLTAMNPLTAVCFILSAVALLVWRRGATGPRSLLTLFLAMVVATFGLVRLGGYVFGWDLPFDRALFGSRLDQWGGPANRMAPNTAVNFMLVGLMIGSLGARRSTITVLAAAAAMLTSATALLGYAYSVTSLVQVAAFIPMALHTAVLFVLISIAAVCHTSGTGMMEALTRRTAGGRVFRRMIPTLVFGPPVLGWLRLQGELAGMFGASFGVALFVGAMTVMGLALTFVTARSVDAGEAERRRADEIILKLAHFDTLTGLPNRYLLGDRIRQALARADRAGDGVAMLFLDLDGFKRVNDTLGHEAGDLVLREAARRIQGALRTVDTAARLGGDEFTVVLERIRAAADVTKVAKRLLGELSKPYLVNGIQTHLSSSIGVSMFPEHGREPDELLSLADRAMYRAKHAGKNQVAFHTPAAREQPVVVIARAAPSCVISVSGLRGELCD
ncbi:MAG: GGDEF domain-containing protein [Deltaproteobacteria bacterium]|nr:GGDEF domain-containing protein [Deltaproteobacteria bacterium]